MEERLWTVLTDLFDNQKFENVQQLLELEQQLIRSRRRWENDLDDIVKQLYRLKRAGVLN